MRIATMKAFHYAHDWPIDYLEAFVSGERLEKCSDGHMDCSIEPGGPCVVYAIRRARDHIAARDD